MRNTLGDNSFQIWGSVNISVPETDCLASPGLLAQLPACSLSARNRRTLSTLMSIHTKPLQPNSNDFSFELLRRSEQPTAVVHETICEQVRW